ncbi:MAG: hypothetical protein LBC61_07010 [Candidatus Peribacteria bacterium]|nr:hypothetical protein [Candidatus Peribacteria bacterium]
MKTWSRACVVIPEFV